MIKVGIADYGLNCWYGALYDYNQRFEMLKKIGYDGIERIEVRSAAEAMDVSATAKRLGMDFCTCRGGTASESIMWTAALGKPYVWVESKDKELDVFCRQTNAQIDAAEKYGIKVALHNHLGLTVETSEQLDYFMQKCPKCQLILDVGHFSAAGGNSVEAIKKYSDRIAAIHLKDYVYKDKSAEYWWDRLRFCELGAGVMGDENARIIKTLSDIGYSGWIFVEHDTHLQDPIIDLTVSRNYIKQFGI